MMLFCFYLVCFFLPILILLSKFLVLGAISLCCGEYSHRFTSFNADGSRYLSGGIASHTRPKIFHFRIVQNQKPCCSNLKLAREVNVSYFPQGRLCARKQCQIARSFSRGHVTRTSVNSHGTSLVRAKKVPNG